MSVCMCVCVCVAILCSLFTFIYYCLCTYFLHIFHLCSLFLFNFIFLYLYYICLISLIIFFVYIMLLIHCLASHFMSTPFWVLSYMYPHSVLSPDDVNTRKRSGSVFHFSPCGYQHILGSRVIK